MPTLRGGGWWRSLLVGLATGGLGALIVLSPLGTSFEEEVGLVWLFNMRGAVEPPPEVAIVAISGDTGTSLGLPKLPRDWPRTVHASLLDNLVPRPAVTVFDIDFNRARSAYEDLVLADAIGRAGNVLLFERLIGKRQPVATVDGQPSGWTWVEEKQGPTRPLAQTARGLAPFTLPKTAAAAFQFWAFKPSGGEVPTLPAMALQLATLPLYQPWRDALAAAGATGLEALPATRDAIRHQDDIRQVMGLLRHAFQTDPLLATRVRQELGIDTGRPANDDARQLDALVALYDGAPERYLNFYGPPGTIATIPYERLAKIAPATGVAALARAARPVPEVDLAGKTVFIGYSDLFEPDQPDRFYTVFTNEAGIDLSGVEIMATAFGNLWTDTSLRPVDGIEAAVLLLGFGFLVGTLLAMLPALYSVPIAAALVVGSAYAAQLAFDRHQLWLPMATPFLVQVPFALVLGLLTQYLIGRQRQRQMSRTMSYYLPANVVRDLTEGTLSPGSVDRVVEGTCFATDMAGFSTIAEKTPPSELATFMNAYFDALAQALKRHNVDVTEFHADTIMSVWLAGESGLAKRREAVLAAIDTVHAIEAFGRTRQGLALSPRVGLQDGQIYLGHTGGGGRLAYSILGDPANTASRLESLNKHLGTRILAAASVVAGVDDVLLRPLGRFQLKGRADPTPIVEIVGAAADASTEDLERCDRFAAALAAFEAHDWAAAQQLFEDLLARWPDDGPARFYLDVARERATQPVESGDPAIIAMDVK